MRGGRGGRRRGERRTLDPPPPPPSPSKETPESKNALYFIAIIAINIAMYLSHTTITTTTIATTTITTTTTIVTMARPFTGVETSVINQPSGWWLHVLYWHALSKAVRMLNEGHIFSIPRPSTWPQRCSIAHVQRLIFSLQRPGIRPQFCTIAKACLRYPALVSGLSCAPKHTCSGSFSRYPALVCLRCWFRVAERSFPVHATYSTCAELLAFSDCVSALDQLLTSGQCKFVTGSTCRKRSQE